MSMGIKKDIVAVILAIFILLGFCYVITSDPASYITYNVKVYKILQTWNGDNAPYERVLASNGQQYVFSCDYYKVNGSITLVQAQSHPLFISTYNYSTPYPIQVGGC